MEARCVLGTIGVQNERKDLHLLADDALVELVRNGNEYAVELLIDRHKYLVIRKSQSYFLIGGDRQDLVQEGMIGLYQAILDFDQNKLSSFKAFASICIERKIITAIKAATRQKHTPLNTYVSIYEKVYNEEVNMTWTDMIAEPTVTDPHRILLDQDLFYYIEDKLLKHLSQYEYNVIHLHLDGHTYEEISEKLKTHVKSVDNALQRIKRKFSKLLHFNKM